MAKYFIKKDIMKPKINVIDLDNTLIPFDSFQKLVLNYVIKCNCKITIITFLRFVRLIKASYFKEKIINILEKENAISEMYKDFAEKVLININEDILKIVEAHSKDDDVINILCSASPKGYVQIIAEKLGWIGYGSGYYNGKFINMYGKNKEKFIKERYPIDRYKYNFAISDSESDINLLKLFGNYKLLKR